MIRKEVLIVLVTFCLTATLFSIIPVGSQGVRGYDPWYDVTGPTPNQPDGKIDLRDYYAMGLKFGTEGDPTKNVSVTNWPEWMKAGMSLPIATKHLTAMLNASIHGSAAHPPCVLNESKQVTGLGSKNLTFISGSLSGGGTWVTYVSNLNGETPGVGRVEVYDASDNLLAQLTLPLDAMINVRSVDKVIVYAESPMPYIAGDGGYSVCVRASVYWIEQ